MHDTLIIGIATVDAIARPVDAFPAPGGLRFFDDLTISTGGCAVNSAIALSRLGVPCDVAVRLGADMLGDFVVRELERHGVPTVHVRREPPPDKGGRTTSFSFAAVTPAGERSFLHTTGANARLSRADVPDALLRRRRFVFVTGTMLMETFDGAETAEVLGAARAAGAATLLDTVFVEGAQRSEWWRRVAPALPHLDYFIPSEPEAQALAGADDIVHAAREFRSAGVRNVVVKMGESGVFAADEAGREMMVPAFEVERVVDATGAGDCWAAGFICALREGLGLEAAARRGNAVAARSIQAAGATAGVPTLHEARCMEEGRG